MKRALLLLLPVTAAMGSPIVFTFQGTATGTMGTTPFTSVPYTVTSLADTASVFFSGGTIDIAGLPQATFTQAMYWADPQGADDIIFGESGGDIFPGILGITVFGVGLDTYNLQSSFGPVFSAIDFPSSIFHSFENVPTSEGSLTLVASDETFTAVASTPEPGSLLLVGIALAALPRLRKTSRRRT